MSFRDVTFLCLLCVLPERSIGANLMRSEPKQVKQSQLQPVKDLLEFPEFDLASPELETVATGKKGKTPSLQEAQRQDYCEWDYPLGKEPAVGADPADECMNANEETIVLDRDECIKAGALAGAKTSYDSFEIDHFWFDKHPIGCFYMKGCTEDTNGHCYFYNAATDAQQEKTVARAGIPVCRRDKYKMGTKDSTGGANGGCPTGYEVITEELGDRGCKAAASCKDWKTGTPFLVGTYNASREQDYPVGCFQENMGGAVTQETVWLNNGTLFSVGTVNGPTHPEGTPICIVSNVNSFASSGTTNTANTTASGTTATTNEETESTNEETERHCAASNTVPCSADACPQGFVNGFKYGLKPHSNLHLLCCGGATCNATLDVHTCCEATERNCAPNAVCSQAQCGAGSLKGHANLVCCDGPTCAVGDDNCCDPAPPALM